MTSRLSQICFVSLLKKLKLGLYSDRYFLRTSEILNKDNHHPHVMMQIFQRNHAVLCGMDEAIAIIKKCSHTS